MCFIARAHAQRVYNRFVGSTRQAVSVQRKVLFKKLSRNADSSFGRDYHFDSIGSVKDFIRAVPILGYEDHLPYIERVKSGEISAMFGGGQKVRMFALTSGTTQEPKYIPVTDHFLREYRRGWNAFGIKALLDHPEALLRGIVQVTSRMDESSTPAGIPCGAITGLMAATQKRLVRKYYLTPRCIAEIDDATAKYYTIMRLAVAADVAFLITANPATQLKLARTADVHRDLLIRDIHDGTLNKDFALPQGVRDILTPRLAADRFAAGRLEKIVSEHGRLLPKHYWDLAFIANWTGGTMRLYLQEFGEYFGDVPVRDIGLLASEGRVSIPIDDGTAAGILDVSSNFFEFVPKDRIDEASPPTFRCHEVDIGEEYYVLMTTSSGLYRYDLKDLVRVVGFAGGAPIIEFLNKGTHICSLSGEKLSERQVILAMEAVARRLGIKIVNFVLAPQWDSLPYYSLHVEGGSPERDSQLGDLAGEMDTQLQAVNVEYASKRKSDRLGPVRLNILLAGYLSQVDRARAERHRRGNEQYKHQYLYCKPGEDEDLICAGAVPGYANKIVY
ncbi:MAG: GH3 auxin-responsive promoter family protein [Planctomycetota bacterium]